MSVPRASSLGLDVAVNIVLKADQSTGKLTAGKIQDLLSRGDHPRGIKVRLQDGKIGRVQSLVDVETAAATGSITPSGQAASQGDSKQYIIQEDHRYMPQIPSQEGSLEDYIKIKPAKRNLNAAKGKSIEAESEKSPKDEDSQAMLQQEFPDLDSALVAAILSDSENMENARTTLEALVSS